MLFIPNPPYSSPRPNHPPLSANLQGVDLSSPPSLKKLFLSYIFLLLTLKIDIFTFFGKSTWAYLSSFCL